MCIENNMGDNIDSVFWGLLKPGLILDKMAQGQ